MVKRTLLLQSNGLQRPNQEQSYKLLVKSMKRTRSILSKRKRPEGKGMKAETSNKNEIQWIAVDKLPLQEDKTLSDFSLSLRCIQLRRDIYHMLDLQWVAEICNYNKERLPGSSMEVHSMAEFYERIEKDDYNTTSTFSGQKRTGLRRYEQVDIWKTVQPKHKELS